MKIETPYYTITPESIARERARLSEKARHDEAQALHHAEQMGFQKGIFQYNVEIVRNALEMQLPIDTISQLTGLCTEEIEKLVQQPEN